MRTRLEELRNGKEGENAVFVKLAILHSHPMFTLRSWAEVAARLSPRMWDSRGTKAAWAKPREARARSDQKDSLLGTQVDRQIYEAGLVRFLQVEMTLWDWCLHILFAHLGLLTLNPPRASAVKFLKTLPTAPLSFLTGTMGT